MRIVKKGEMLYYNDIINMENNMKWYENEEILKVYTSAFNWQYKGESPFDEGKFISDIHEIVKENTWSKETYNEMIGEMLSSAEDEWSELQCKYQGC